LGQKITLLIKTLVAHKDPGIYKVRKIIHPQPTKIPVNGKKVFKL